MSRDVACAAPTAARPLRPFAWFDAGRPGSVLAISPAERNSPALDLEARLPTLSRNSPQIGVFGRLPGGVPGKTRLARDVGPARAEALARAFLADQLDRARILAPGATWWWVAGGGDGDEAAALAAAAESGHAPPGTRLAAQRGGHLGARMEHALDTMLEAGPAVLVGADAPDAPLAALRHAVALLADESDHGHRPRLVLGPALDGGFWLIGVDAPPAGLLAARAAWGTPGVLARTRQDAERGGVAWEVREVEGWSDVDTGTDLAALASRLRAARALGEAARPGWPRRTAALVLAQGAGGMSVGG